MAPKNRIIIDTDPGVDDILALLLALAASPEELEVVMISVTYGNVQLQNCLRNVVAMFHVLEKEMNWRKAAGKATYGGLNAFKPIVAVGAEHALEDGVLMADHFHGVDGLHGVHDTLPHLSPADTWRSLFLDPTAGPSITDELPAYSNFFTPSNTPAHKEILRILRSEPADTITILAIGPLTNLALAAAEDAEIFLRVKEVVVMGGAVHVEGNITPWAEFNCYADTVAAARVFALTSPNPASTMPPAPSTDTRNHLPPYQAGLPRQLKLSLFPLDITTPHELRKRPFAEAMTRYKAAGSPLATWIDHFVSRTFVQIDSMVGPEAEAGLSLHDPMTVWYMLTRDDPAWKAIPAPGEDIRVETAGQWTRGMHVVNCRARLIMDADVPDTVVVTHPPDDKFTLDDVPGDTVSAHRGNRINRIVASPGKDIFAPMLMKRIFE